MPDNIDYLQGIIERLTFHSEETGYTVARLKVPKAQDLITVVGNFANIQAGQTLALEGTWRSSCYLCQKTCDRLFVNLRRSRLWLDWYAIGVLLRIVQCDRFLVIFLSVLENL